MCRPAAPVFGGICVPRERAGAEPEYYCGRLACIILVPALSALCVVPLAG